MVGGTEYGGVGVGVRAGWELMRVFSGEHQRRWNTDFTDTTDNTDCENTRIRYPDCGTRKGSQSVKIRNIRLNPCSISTCARGPLEVRELTSIF